MTKGQERGRRSDFGTIAGSHVRHFQSAFHSLAAAKLPVAGSKYACVIAKKTASRAVDRNRARRRCREMLRSALRNAKDPAAFFIVRIKRAAQGASYAELQRDIEKLVQEAVSRRGAK